MLRFLGFALLLAIALAVLAPAALLAPQVGTLSGGALTLHDAEGTVWNGRGTLAVQGQRLPVAWRVEPAAVVGGELAVRVTAPDGPRATPRVRLAARRDGFVLADADFALPAAALLRDPAARATLALDGTLGVRIAMLERRGNGYHGAAELTWTGARLRFAPGSPALDLGSVSVALQGTGDRLEGPLSNRGGAVALGGAAGIDASGTPTLDVLVTPRAPLDPALTNLLRAAGHAEGDGWRLRWPARGQ
ncbi:MAG TPA: type II secretion system protein N [Casimicrobiaceae bacterium]|nr:type II secretion system protein N [Casimicrobiaceae bacterium]